MQERSTALESVIDIPLIQSETCLPEITIKSVILAIILTAFLGAANAYLALKLGQTVGASIPAAIIAMGALRFFRNHNVLENNIVQTAATTGEGTACALAFVLPALLMTGYWQHFHYWETALMTLIGGFFGVLFSIPLRKVMLNYPGLNFPEGTAVGNVLKASSTGNAKMKYLVNGGLSGGIIVLFQSAFKVLSENWPIWFSNGKIIFGLGLGFSPALLAAGFIVGVQACIGLLTGIFFGWLLGVPIYSYLYGLPHVGSYYEMAMSLRADHIRYIGVGTMLLGGAWTLITLVRPIILSLSMSWNSLRQTQANSSNLQILRTDRDIPIKYILFACAALSVSAFIVFLHFFNQDTLALSANMRYGVSIFAVFYLLVVGFLLASVCSYIVGMVGVTNNPISGLILGSVLMSSLFLLPIFTPLAHQHPEIAKLSVSVVIIITTVVGISVIISAETLQDLKAGRMVGATPWKQQVMMLIGVVVASLILGPAFELLFRAYGVGGVFPHSGMDPGQMLSAPQAGLVAAVSQGVFGNSLAWKDIIIGMIIAVFAIMVDEFLKKKNLRLPVLAIGIGIYLPPEITSCVIMGGILNSVCKHRVKKLGLSSHAFENSTLLACGLVAGAALMGVILAVPFVLKGSSDALSLVPASFTSIAHGLGFVILVLLCIWLYKTTIKNS